MHNTPRIEHTSHTGENCPACEHVMTIGRTIGGLLGTLEPADAFHVMTIVLGTGIQAFAKDSESLPLLAMEVCRAIVSHCGGKLETAEVSPAQLQRLRDERSMASRFDELPTGTVLAPASKRSH